MSLELIIKENTEIMRQLITAIQSNAIVQLNPPLKPENLPLPIKSETEETNESLTDPKALFAQAEKLILLLAKNGYRNEAVEILTQFEAKKLGQVPEDKLAEVIDLAKKVLKG